MAIADETIGPNQERAPGAENRFAKMSDLHLRYTVSKDRMREKMEKWRNYWQSYRRYPIKRSHGRVDANYGQFKFEIDNEIATFQSLILNRPTWITIIPKDAPDKTTKMDWSHRISECWHEEFIAPWHEKAENTNYDLFDMTMFMAGIEFWPNKGTIYPENVQIETCFPDLLAGTNPKKWETFFIYRRMSYLQLQERYENDKDDKWDKNSLKDLLESKQNRVDELTRFEALRLDTKETLNTENSILLLYAFVKEYDGKITKYIIPENGIIIAQQGSSKIDDRYLFREENYCDHIGQVVAIRTYHRFKYYWSGQSLADDIFLTKLQGDQAQNKILRSAVRAATTFVNSSNADTQEKLQKIQDEEIIVLDADVKVNAQNIPANTTDLLNAIRQLNFDTDRQTRDTMPAGSQNVKGRAITAEEAGNQQLQSAERRSIKTDLFVQNDQRYGEELYRRSMKVTKAEDGGNALDRFKKKMEYYGIPEEAYEFDNVVINSSFSMMGGHMAARMAAGDKLIALTRIKPESIQVYRAKREAIANLTDYSQADYFCESPDQPIDPIQARFAGVENEIMDNSNLNPLNAQVFADDNHVFHLGKMHLPDIENDLKWIQQLLGQYIELPISAKAVYIYKFQDQLKASDNKFAHCISHLQMMELDGGLEAEIKFFENEMNRLRAAYTTLSKLMRQAIDQFAQETQANAYLTEENRLRIEDRQNEVTYRQQLREVGLGKAVDQAQLAQQRAMAKQQQQDTKAVQEAKQAEIRQGVEIDGIISRDAAKLAGQQSKNLIDSRKAVQEDTKTE